MMPHTRVNDAVMLTGLFLFMMFVLHSKLTAEYSEISIHFYQTAWHTAEDIKLQHDLLLQNM
jgi:hypothetical protein